MKRFIILITLAVFLQNAYADSVYEIVSTKFKDGIHYPSQLKAMQSLDSIVSSFSGFVSRQFYYSDELNRWTDIVIWTDQGSAIEASKQAFNNSEAFKVFSLMDEGSQIFSYNRLVGKTEISVDALH